MTSDLYIGIATSQAEVVVLHARLDPAERAAAHHILQGLLETGHVAAYSVTSLQAGQDWMGTVAWMRSRFGGFTVDAVAGAPLRDEEPPAYLIPVWPFDHQISGRPASSGRFLGLEMDIRAEPALDEQSGTILRGWPGLWTIRAQPF